MGVFPVTTEVYKALEGFVSFPSGTSTENQKDNGSIPDQVNSAMKIEPTSGLESFTVPAQEQQKLQELAPTLTVQVEQVHEEPVLPEHGYIDQNQNQTQHILDNSKTNTNLNKTTQKEDHHQFIETNVNQQNKLIIENVMQPQEMPGGITKLQPSLIKNFNFIYLCTLSSQIYKNPTKRPTFIERALPDKLGVTTEQWALLLTNNPRYREDSNFTELFSSWSTLLLNQSIYDNLPEADQIFSVYRVFNPKASARDWARVVHNEFSYTCAISGLPSVGDLLHKPPYKIVIHHLFNKANFPKLASNVAGGLPLLKIYHQQFHNMFRSQKTTINDFIDYLKYLKAGEYGKLTTNNKNDILLPVNYKRIDVLISYLTDLNTLFLSDSEYGPYIVENSK